MMRAALKRNIVRQIVTVIVVALACYIISQLTDKVGSFIFGMICYWLILIAQLFIINKTKGLKEWLTEIFSKSKNIWLSLVCFVPSVLVLIVAFIPLIISFDISILLTTLLIGLVNGFLEECYWRGSIYKESGLILAVISTILFAANHGAFLFFDISYQGGAPNLIGGPFIMGAIWIFAAKKTMTIKYGILAHQIVNTLAFYSLFIANG